MQHKPVSVKIPSLFALHHWIKSLNFPVYSFSFWRQCIPCLKSNVLLNCSQIRYFKSFYLFIYLWLCWFLLLCWLFSSVASSGHSLVVMCGLLIEEASLLASGVWSQQLPLPGLRARLSGRGAQTQLLRGMWDLRGSGIQPTSASLAGGYFTTEPPGKPLDFFYCGKIHIA